MSNKTCLNKKEKNNNMRKITKKIKEFATDDVVFWVTMAKISTYLCIFALLVDIFILLVYGFHGNKLF